MNILVINCGSSSIKYQLINMNDEQALFEGIYQNIGSGNGELLHENYVRKNGGQTEVERIVKPVSCATHAEALKLIDELIVEIRSKHNFSAPKAVGHRIVHGGDAFSEPVLIDHEVLDAVNGLSELAPLHNPVNVMGVEASMELYPQVPHVAVFDTAFHQTMPEYAYRYAVPASWYDDYKVRRYGFHGTSHANVVKQAAAYLGRELQQLNLISLHLGNGASAAAIQAGECIDTSMGLTPLEGLIMGTRSGDVDPEVALYIQQLTGETAADISQKLNKQSGLKALCGTANMRDIVQRSLAGDRDAELALDMFCYRIIKYIGAYWAVLGNVDAVIFTAGIGENSAQVRERVCSGISALGVKMDDEKNQGGSGDGGDVYEISSHNSELKVLVVDTNEELEIARQVVTCVG